LDSVLRIAPDLMRGNAPPESLALLRIFLFPFFRLNTGSKRKNGCHVAKNQRKTETQLG